MATYTHTPTAWIFNMAEANARNPCTGWEVGSTSTLWVVECSRLRADGKGAGEPGVRDGETVFVVFTPCGRVVAECEVVGDPFYDDQQMRWYVNLYIRERDFGAPTLKSFGLKLSQGSLKRIGPDDERRISNGLLKA